MFSTSLRTAFWAMTISRSGASPPGCWNGARGSNRWVCHRRSPGAPSNRHKAACKAKISPCNLVIGSTALKEALYLGKIAQESGYDAIASVPPFYYQYKKEEIFAYYEALTKRIKLPLFIYNIPSNTNINFSFTDLDYLLKIDNIIGLKHTSTDFFVIERVKEHNPDSIIFNGPDQMLLAGLSMGCDGGIGSTYNLLPDDFCKIFYSFQNGDWSTSKKYRVRRPPAVFVSKAVGISDQNNSERNRRTHFFRAQEARSDKFVEGRNQFRWKT